MSMRVNSLVGLYVGILDEQELAVFEKAIKDGIAYRSYDFLGLAKVALR